MCFVQLCTRAMSAWRYKVWLWRLLKRGLLAHQVRLLYLIAIQILRLTAPHKALSAMYVSLYRPMRIYVIVAHFNERNTSYVQSWTFDPTTLVRVQCIGKYSNLLLRILAAICAWESSCTQESK